MSCEETTISIYIARHTVAAPHARRTLLSETEFYPEPFWGSVTQLCWFDVDHATEEASVETFI